MPLTQPPPDRAIGRERPDRPAAGLRTLFLCILGFWVIVPFAFVHNFGQDGLPFVVVGHLARDHPADVYTTNGDLFTPTPRFLQETCDLAPPGTDCPNVSVAFVSPPLVLPVTYLLGPLGGDGGVFVLRLAAALSLAGGMWILWRRLTEVRAELGVALVALALLLTPFVMVPLSLGQNAPFMFLSACLGTEEGDRTSRAVGIAAVLSLAVAFKFSPIVLVGVLVWQRRWKVVAATAGILGVLTVVTAATFSRSLFGDFLNATRSLTTTAVGNPYNGAIESNLHEIWAPLVSTTAGSALSTLVRLAVAGGLFWWVGRRADRDTQWAYAWVLLLLFLPLVWWHYLLVSIPAVAYAWRARARDSGWSDRSFLVVIGVAAVTVPISIPNTQGSSWPLVQAAYLVGIVVLVPILLRWSPAVRSRREEVVAPAG